MQNRLRKITIYGTFSFKKSILTPKWSKSKQNLTLGTIRAEFWEISYLYGTDSCALPNSRNFFENYFQIGFLDSDKLRKSDLENDLVFRSDHHKM